MAFVCLADPFIYTGKYSYSVPFKSLFLSQEKCPFPCLQISKFKYCYNILNEFAPNRNDVYMVWDYFIEHVSSILDVLLIYQVLNEPNVNTRAFLKVCLT